MPTRIEIEDAQAALIVTAEAERTQRNLAQTKRVTVAEKQIEREIINAALMTDILAARFEINNKLVYTNDDQRRIALVEAQVASVDYQATLAAETTAQTERVTADAQAELHRKTYRADELMLEYMVKVSESL